MSDAMAWSRLDLRSGVAMSEKPSEEFNRLCIKCIRTCKQPVAMLMLECPRFQPRPFKSETHRFQQLDLFGKPKE